MAGSRGLIRRYYLFRLTNTSGFFLPVAIIVLHDKGFGLGFIGFAYAVYAAAQLVVEVPTGYVGDWLGRRASLALGSLVRVGVLGVYPFVDTAAVYLAVHVCWAVGRSFRSGTQDAWLYEILQARFDESEFARVESRGRTLELVVDAATAAVGGLLYTVDPTVPFLGTAVIAAVGVPVLYSFPSIDELTHGAAPDDGDLLTVRDAVSLLRLQAGRPSVRWFVLLVALFYSVFVVTRIYEQPALDAVGVPVAAFGPLYAGFKLFSAGVAASVGRVHDRLGTRGVMLAVMPVYAVAYGSVLVAPMLVVPVLFVNRGLNTLVKPVRNQYLNDRLANVGRATVLSGASMVLAVAGGTARLVASHGTELLGAVGFLPLAGVTLSFAAMVLWLLVSPVRPSDRAPASGNADRAAAE